MRESQRLSELQIQSVGSTLGWSQFTKEHYSVKTVDGPMVLNICTSSDNAKYLYQASRKYHEGLQRYLANAICIPKNNYNSNVGGYGT